MISFQFSRGGEVSRLSLEEWKDGERDDWVDDQRVKDLSPAEKLLTDSLKMVYLSGKGNHHLVSLLIPKDTVASMIKLSKPEVRKESGVDESNQFVFASTQSSLSNCSGWHALKEVCNSVKLKCPQLMNATNNRHRVSTIYASLNIPEKDREIFYSHMGHSAKINQDVYQNPLALRGIINLGPKLLAINGKFLCLDAKNWSCLVIFTYIILRCLIFVFFIFMVLGESCSGETSGRLNKDSDVDSFLEGKT